MREAPPGCGCHVVAAQMKNGVVGGKLVHLLLLWPSLLPAWLSPLLPSWLACCCCCFTLLLSEPAFLGRHWTEQLLGHWPLECETPFWDYSSFWSWVLQGWSNYPGLDLSGVRNLCYCFNISLFRRIYVCTYNLLNLFTLWVLVLQRTLNNIRKMDTG